MKFSWKALLLAPLLAPLLYSIALIILLPSKSPMLLFLILFVIGSLFSYGVTFFLFFPGLFLISKWTLLTARVVGTVGTALGGLAYMPVAWQMFLASGDNSGPPSGSFADYLWKDLSEPLAWAFPVAGFITALVYWFIVNQPPRNRYVLNRPKIVVRPEQPGDSTAIHAIHAASFPTDAEARLVGLLRQVERLPISLVAEVDGATVGHIAFSPVAVAGEAIGAGLAPIAVLPTHRRQGIAAQLIKTGLAECRSAGFGWAVVLGEPEYYSRFGFEPASVVGLSDEYGGGPAFQAIELVPGQLPSGAGVVRYAPEFASLATGDHK